MDAARLDQVQRLFHEALELQPDQRAQFLEEACGEDTALKETVLRYLRADESSYSLIDRPIATLDQILGPGTDILQPGDRVGNYVIKRLLGEGGMGVVYLAHDPKLERDIAVKLLSPQLMSNPAAKERLLSEAKMAATLDHPHISTIYEVGESEEGLTFIAMGYYEGETLGARIAANNLSEEDAVQFTLQIAKGLSSAHKRKIVHRDIKPANLLVTTEGVIKIVDFGIAKIVDQEVTGSAQMVGTISYMSPEQAQGDSVDHRTDLWSLGVVLYEMLTGDRPFSGEHPQATIHAIIHREPVTEPLDKSALGSELRRVINGLLAKRPEYRYQLAEDLIEDLEHILRGEEPGSRSKINVPEERFPDNLPIPLSSFVGRTKEQQELIALLKRERLVTITGVGGTGKTRFSIQVGDTLRKAFIHGVCFVQLSTLNNPAHVIFAIAQALDVREMEGVLIKDRVLSYLEGKEGLLILDNFEHVIEAGDLISELLLACKNLKVLVTSRTSLRIQGEQEYPLPPLGIVLGETMEEVSASEAVQLFEQRARAVKPNFNVNAANASDLSLICKRLDGLPLALELAAARIKVLSTKAILTRLEHRLDLLTGGARDMPARHRTLREAIAWSYDLLSRPEKKLFQWLSVFVRGFTFEAAAFIYERVGDGRADLFDDLSSLVDKNLVQQKELEDGESWFFMLETIREFGRECLIAGGDQEIVESAHCACFAAFADDAGSKLVGEQQVVWLDRIEQDHDNLRAAIAYALDHQDNKAVLVKFGVALWRFWLIRGYFVEGIEFLEKIIECVKNDVDSKTKARLLTGAGTLAHNFGQYAKALGHFDSCLSLFHTLGDDTGLAKTLSNEGWINWRIGNFPSAKILSEESLWLYQQLKDKQGVATAKNNLGWIAQYQGSILEAKEHFEYVLATHKALKNIREAAFAKNSVAWALASLQKTEPALELLYEAISTFEDIGEKQLTAFTQSRLGAVLLDIGQVQEAYDLVLMEALPLFGRIGDAWGTSFASKIGSCICIRKGDLENAERLCKEGHAISTGLGDSNGIAEALMIRGLLQRVRLEYSEADDLYKEALTLKVFVEDKAGQLLALEGLACIAAHMSDVEHAALVLGATSALRKKLVIPRWRMEEADFNSHMKHIKGHMSKSTFEQAWATGQEYTLEDVLKKI